MLPTPIVAENEQVYEPAEDLFLLLDCFEQEKNYLQNRFRAPVVVEVGTGSGIVSTFIKKHIATSTSHVISTDLNPHACRQAMETLTANGLHSGAIDVVQTSLTAGVRPQIVDVLVFNPPYVPAEEVPPTPQREDDPTWLDLALCGGPQGMDVTWELLDGLDLILSVKGVAYILFCARNEPDKVRHQMEHRGWHTEVVILRKAGWEVLCVIRFERGEKQT